MEISWWPVALAFLIGGMIGGLIPLFVIANGWLGFFCKRGILCVATKVHEEPQQVHLSWVGAPDRSLTVTWVTRVSRNGAIQLARVLGPVVAGAEKRIVARGRYAAPGMP
jgi:hypothetical protein